MWLSVAEQAQVEFRQGTGLRRDVLAILKVATSGGQYPAQPMGKGEKKHKYHKKIKQNHGKRHDGYCCVASLGGGGVGLQPVFVMACW